MFEFQPPRTTITEMFVEYDAVNNKHQVVVNGEGLDDTLDLWIDGHQQTLVSQDGATAYFDLTEIENSETSDVKIYTDMGYPEGAEIVHTLSFVPALLSIVPDVGNTGGSEIIVTGSGFGPSTEGLNLSANGFDLCEEVEITGYGTFVCKTRPMEVATGASVQIMYGSGDVSDHVAEGVTFEQQEIITVSEIASAGTSITFTGTGFPMDGLIGHASIGGLNADVVAVTSDTEATASWSTTGIPQTSEAPVLYFADDA